MEKSQIESPKGISEEETKKRQNVKTSKRQNVKTSKRQNNKTTKRQNNKITKQPGNPKITIYEIIKVRTVGFSFRTRAFSFCPGIIG